MFRELLNMFLLFFRIGAVTFGGGYAMLPILQRELVENRDWTTEEELADYFAIGQCTPGIIAVNTATCRQKQGDVHGQSGLVHHGGLDELQHRVENKHAHADPNARQGVLHPEDARKIIRSAGGYDRHFGEHPRPHRGEHGDLCGL